MGLDNPLHIAALVVLILLIFGARRLPEIGRSLGQGMREFKESVTGESKPPAIGAGEQAPGAQAAPAQGAAQPAAPEPASAQGTGSETVTPQ
ncbi:MAG TPA: twin-arginine translocase TatA/TatE family subunit [Solirubrobacteraceae bacterium]|jgi:sec-independent protein translocase protein TatA|nr:twin-arginine translocase TatA/TatE family subunit [Solirubrobacteraceae bacterium]